MKQIALFCVALIISLNATSQNIINDIDGIFSTWTRANSPGGVVLVSHKKQIIFSKAYGLTNIPFQIPITNETVFNIGSLSKQFTAMGIVLLQLDGKLSFDDDIQKYLPEFPSFGKKITIRNLLHHTSGLRGTELFGLVGWREGDAITNEDAYRYLTKQKSLNFEPGAEYMYSNSGYILLAKIIENITKQDFKSWMKEKIFQPLQLNATFIEEDYTKIVSKTANSYTEIEPSVFINVENYDLTYGASNVYATSTDILKWSKNYYDAPKDWQKAFAILSTVDVLNSGEKNNYAFGIFVEDFFGNRRIQHTGAIAGFRAIMYCYPDEELEIIILTNYSISNQLTKNANQISQLFLQNKTAITASSESIKPLKLPIEVLKKYEGTYWTDKNNFSRKIYLEKDDLWYLRTNNKKSPLIPISETEFQMGGVDEKLRLFFDVNANKMTMIAADNSLDVFEKYEEKSLTTEDLKAYTGVFYSPELETFYTIQLKDEKLNGYHSRFGDFEIQILKNDVVSWSGFAVSKYKRNENGEILGFNVTINRVRDLWFEKK